jgi:hypothetical protein
LAVGHADAELFCTVGDSNAVALGNVVCNLSTVLAVVHEEKFDFSNVADLELAESVGEDVAGLLVRSVTNVGHQDASLEFPADATINTLLSAPRFL